MNRILLYGATGYSGRLIAREAARRQRTKRWSGHLTLAARDRSALQELAEELDLPYSAFALDDRDPVVRALQGFDVLINAAGPFARTASRLAKAALDTPCHYVDLNGETDVYLSLDDLALVAYRRALAMVCAAGWTTVASDLLLDHAIRTLASDKDLQVLRIAMSRNAFVSRGDAITMAQALREQVVVVRGGALLHLPIGQLERKFDFATAPGRGARIASAYNVPDTLTAKRTLERHRLSVPDIESYLAMGERTRTAYWLASLGAVALYLPFVQRIVAAQLSILPEGPRDDQRKGLRETVTLEIENKWCETVASWVLETVNFYDFTACSALDIGIKLAAASKPLPDGLIGWLTPSAVLSYGGSNPLNAQPYASPFHGSVLRNRL